MAKQSVSEADCVIQGQVIPHELLGPLEDSAELLGDAPRLHSRLDETGYLFLRGVLDVDDVLTAREEVFSRLIEVGEIKPPAIEGIATGESRRSELVEDLGEFWQSVSEGPKLRHVSHGPRVREIMQTVFGEPARPQDYIFLRPSPVGRSTHLHYDYPFFSRGSQRVHTVWIALGDVPVTEGPLVVIEGSNRFDDLIEPVRQIDYESNDSPQVQLTGNAVEFAESRQARLLTTDFQVGDLIIFSMTTLHGTLDNQSQIGRARLSCDVRYQPAADPIDDRYFGTVLPGTTGAGYAELNGAKPLNQPWHIR